MNTGTVSKLLGVSASTIQRWVKLLELEMERNELGHYVYTKEDIETLKEFKDQIQKGVPTGEIQIERKTRRGSVKIKEVSQGPKQIMEKISKLECELNNKADSVVTYQLLHHRDEIEELKNQMVEIKQLLEKNLEIKTSHSQALNHPTSTHVEKRKKKTKLRSLFSF